MACGQKGEVPTPDGNKFSMQKSDAVSERIVVVKQAVSFFDDVYAPDMYTELFEKLNIYLVFLCLSKA